jgi:uncharacterized protein YigA (DUF484 family)
MDKNAKIMMLDERIKLLTARGSHNDKIVKKLLREKRRLMNSEN